MTHLASLFLLLAALGQSPEVVLLPPGLNPADRVRAADGAPALALCADGLRRIALRVSQAAEPGALEVSAPCDAEVVVANAPGAHRRPRAAAIRPGPLARGSPQGPMRVSLQLGARRWQVERVRLGSTGYRLVLHGGGAPVTLYECQSTDAARWELLWAGDLDGDGRLDLLLDASDAFDLSELRLFLSRGAVEAVDEVALLRRKREDSAR